MPFHSTGELPEMVRNVLPAHAQRIYRSTFNNAWKEYENPNSRRTNIGLEEIAHKVAWNAVKQVYEKTADGKWRKKLP